MECVRERVVSDPDDDGYGESPSSDGSRGFALGDYWNIASYGRPDTPQRFKVAIFWGSLSTGLTPVISSNYNIIMSKHCCIINVISLVFLKLVFCDISSKGSFKKSIQFFSNLDYLC